MAALNRHVLTHPGREGVAVRVRLCGLPEWMPAEVARDIKQSVLPRPVDLNDRELTRRVYDRAAANPWIRKVTRVEKRITDDPRVGVLEVHADYRKPVARVLLEHGRSWAYISDDARRLPDKVPQWVALIPGRDGQAARTAYFLREEDVPAPIQAVPVHYIMIDAASNDPPSVGQPWEGDDIADALKLIKLLWARPYVNQITRVDIRNFDWDASRREPRLRLVAQKQRGPETVILFGRFPNPEGDCVVPPERKLRNLDSYVRQHNGTLAGLARKIDIRCDRLAYTPY
jgi:hypothetical protein